MKLPYPLLTVVLTMLLSFTTQVQAFVLTLNTDKLEYVCGEPVVLYVSLQNTDSTSVELPRYLDPKYYEVQYEINGKRFIPWILVDAIKPTKRFASGEILREEVKLFFDGKQWIFSKPGTYTIIAKLRGQSSNTLTINVQSPCGSNGSSLPSEVSSTSSAEALAQAAQLLLKTHDAGFFLLFEGEGAHFLTDAIKVLQQISTDYPDTPQATFAKQALGNFHRFIENYEEALPLLEAAKQQPVALYDILHTHLALYKLHKAQGNIQEAKVVLEELKETISEQFSDFKPFVDEVLKTNKIPLLFKQPLYG